MAETMSLEQLRSAFKNDDRSAQRRRELGLLLLKWQKDKPRGRKDFKFLAKLLDRSRDDLYKMAKIASVYPTKRSLPKLTYSHLELLVQVPDASVRDKLASRAKKKRTRKKKEKKMWSVRELKDELASKQRLSFRKQNDLDRMRKGILENDLRKVFLATRQFKRVIDHLCPSERCEKAMTGKKQLRLLLQAIKNTGPRLNALIESYEAWYEALTQ